eukprot:CAMPEP_0172657306 /NCGR_PEP_ID=MMETSP1074-20121228/2014_1 /TAXON_ID=2916 /ORGANISM="Ceratium fusus, Strain PA161109" /LENGTH=65 /DNA_ID=CAMNT_0013472369 /DNA_START=43 /DNA_END=240 /DNA_ORIENTATION=-
MPLPCAAMPDSFATKLVENGCGSSMDWVVKFPSKGRRTSGLADGPPTARSTSVSTASHSLRQQNV